MRSHLYPDIDSRWEVAVDAAYAAIENGTPPTVIAEDLRRLGIAGGADWLLGAFGSLTPREAAVSAFVRAHPVEITSLDPTRDELVEIVRLLLDPDALEPWWAAVLSAHVPHPAPSDLIYNPPADFPESEQTPEGIVARALAYRPIAL